MARCYFLDAACAVLREHAFCLAAHDRWAGREEGLSELAKVEERRLLDGAVL